jgi:WhiB family transcriptional regulator, redox-sensing transcriptional regulator
MPPALHSILTTSVLAPRPVAPVVHLEPTPVVGTPVSIRAAMWNDLSWREQAACHDIATEIFFPVGLTGSSLNETARAKKICRSCAAVDACLEFALRTNQDHGIWGAHTEDERRALRRARRAAARRALANERAAAERLAAERAGLERLNHAHAG